MNENQTNRLKQQALKIGHLVGLFIAMVIICLPGLWVVLSALRPNREIMAKPPIWMPQSLSFDAYRRDLWLRRRPGGDPGARLLPEFDGHLGRRRP
jgi:ABC-type glycerol-3-phosphate transport system permease component